MYTQRRAHNRRSQIKCVCVCVCVYKHIIKRACPQRAMVHRIKYNEQRLETAKNWEKKNMKRSTWNSKARMWNNDGNFAWIPKNNKRRIDKTRIEKEENLLRIAFERIEISTFASFKSCCQSTSFHFSFSHCAFFFLLCLIHSLLFSSAYTTQRRLKDIEKTHGIFQHLDELADW